MSCILSWPRGDKVREVIHYALRLPMPLARRVLHGYQVAAEMAGTTLWKLAAWKLNGALSALSEIELYGGRLTGEEVRGG